MMIHKSDISRADILAKIENASKKRQFILSEPNMSENIYKEPSPSLEECFATELSAISGNCCLCPNEASIYEKIKQLLTDENVEFAFCRDAEISQKLLMHGITTSDKQEDFTDMKVGVTGCEYLVARTGSVMVSAAAEGGRQMNIFPPIHIVVARKSQLVPYVGDALRAIQEKYNGKLPSSITNVTGPSRTADIEKTLVLGAHGPKAIWVFIDLSA